MWNDILGQRPEGVRMQHVAENAGMPYRTLYNVLTKDLCNLKVCEAIKIARAAGVDADTFYYYLHKHGYGDISARPPRGISW